LPVWVTNGIQEVADDVAAAAAGDASAVGAMRTSTSRPTGWGTARAPARSPARTRPAVRDGETQRLLRRNAAGGGAGRAAAAANAAVAERRRRRRPPVVAARDGARAQAGGCSKRRSGRWRSSSRTVQPHAWQVDGHKLSRRQHETHMQTRMIARRACTAPTRMRAPAPSCPRWHRAPYARLTRAPIVRVCRMPLHAARDARWLLAFSVRPPCYGRRTLLLSGEE
jgi:hypothetical protein